MLSCYVALRDWRINGSGRAACRVSIPACGRREERGTGSTTLIRFSLCFVEAIGSTKASIVVLLKIDDSLVTRRTTVL